MNSIPTQADGLAIEVRDLRKSYGETHAVGGVSFDVRRGEVFCLLGPNGAGKTTTVEILEGYRSRSSGEARVLGIDPATGARELREQVGQATGGGTCVAYQSRNPASAGCASERFR